VVPPLDPAPFEPPLLVVPRPPLLLPPVPDAEEALADEVAPVVVPTPAACLQQAAEHPTMTSSARRFMASYRAA
jgi:hypothetical protein